MRISDWSSDVCSSDLLDVMTKMGRWALAALYAEWVGTFRGIGAIVRGVFSGKGLGEILSDVGDAYKGAFDETNSAMIPFGEDVPKKLSSNKLEDLRKQAAEITADQTPKGERHTQRHPTQPTTTKTQTHNPTR